MEFAELNPAQREAVEDLTDNILLLAPAGTGKTNTLACRIANILAEGRAEPEEILCLTFTNKACREMKERIVLRAGEDGRRVLVRTFHGFCYDVIKTEAKRHSDLFADFTIFDEADCLAIIRDLLSEDWPVRSVQSLIALLKEVRTQRPTTRRPCRSSWTKTLLRSGNSPSRSTTSSTASSLSPGRSGVRRLPRATTRACTTCTASTSRTSSCRRRRSLRRRTLRSSGRAASSTSTSMRCRTRASSNTASSRASSAAAAYCSAAITSRPSTSGAARILRSYCAPISGTGSHGASC